MVDWQMRKDDCSLYKIDFSFCKLFCLDDTLSHELLKEIKKKQSFYPIYVWNKIVVHGYPQYKYSIKNRIRWPVIELSFPTKKDALIWACKKELSNHSLLSIHRKYLLGKLVSLLREGNEKLDMLDIKDIVLNDFGNVSCAALYKYQYFSRDFDSMFSNYKIRNKIFSGKIKITITCINKLKKIPKEDLKKIIDSESFDPCMFLRPDNIKASLQALKKVQQPLTIPKIKEFPTLDPDSAVTTLTYTIPFWMSSMTRCIEQTNFTNVSEPASLKLKEELQNLRNSIEIIEAKIFEAK